MKTSVYTVVRDPSLGVYRIFCNGLPFRVVCQTILELRLGIVLSDEEVIALALK